MGCYVHVETTLMRSLSRAGCIDIGGVFQPDPHSGTHVHSNSHTGAYVYPDSYTRAYPDPHAGAYVYPDPNANTPGGRGRSRAG